MDEKVTTPVIKGIVISLVLAVLSIGGQLMDLETESWYKWVTTLLLFGSIIGACILFSKYKAYYNPFYYRGSYFLIHVTY